MCAHIFDLNINIISNFERTSKVSVMIHYLKKFNTFVFQNLDDVNLFISDS